ncbi:MAG: ABC transporter substrate-binding protein [Hylemonella sp.]|nr:ABC transporter substrate-binding protein [Hylemonella sp.]
MMQTISKLAKSGSVLLLGIAALFGLSVPVQAQDIVVGQIGPFSGLPAPDAPQLNQGAKAYFAQLNKAGGINGRKVAFFELDDTYKPDGFVAAFEQAMQRRPVALISPVGSASLQRMFADKLLDKHDVVIMNAVPGAEPFRSPGHPRLFHVRAGDKQQIEKIVNHARTLGILKLAVMHQDIPMGTGGVKVVADEAARLTGMDVKGYQSVFKPEEQTKAAEEVFKSNPQGVIVIGAPPFTAGSVAALRKAGVTQSIFILGDTAPGMLAKVAGAELARGVGIAQIYPNPNGRTRTLAREFQAAMQATHPDIKSYAAFHMEGYLSARILGEGLKRIRGEITPAALAKSLQSMGEIDFDGYRIDFSKGNAGSRFVDIAVMDQEGRLRY